MLTSLTTFFGLIPLTFISPLDKNATFLQPMAVSLSFGILFATIITLFFVPLNMLIARDIKHALKGSSKNSDDPTNNNPASNDQATT